MVISSIEEAVSSSEEDCSSVRCDRLALPCGDLLGAAMHLAGGALHRRDDLGHVVGELVDAAAHGLEEARLAVELDALP